MTQYLKETEYHNFSHPLIQQFLLKTVDEDDSLVEKTIKIYYAIRDGWRYDPFNISFTKKACQASDIMQRNHGHCIDKSNLAVTCLRALGIPAKIHLGKVKNHIGVEKIIEKIGTDELTPHGFLEVFLDGKWIKITPVFNKKLCAKLNVPALEFDGKNDALFQSFDKNGGRFMEYLEDYGCFDDLPWDFILQKFREHYPKEVINMLIER